MNFGHRGITCGCVCGSPKLFGGLAFVGHAIVEKPRSETMHLHPTIKSWSGAKTGTLEVEVYDVGVRSQMDQEAHAAYNSQQDKLLNEKKATWKDAEAKLAKYEVKETLGQGTYGKVVKAIDKETGKAYALKVLE
eukprot:g29109.t1